MRAINLRTIFSLHLKWELDVYLPKEELIPQQMFDFGSISRKNGDATMKFITPFQMNGKHELAAVTPMYFRYPYMGMKW